MTVLRGICRPIFPMVPSAPPNENDTETYARCVAKESGFGIDEPLDVAALRGLGSQLLLGETISPSVAAGLIAAIAGVALINAPTRKALDNGPSAPPTECDQFQR